MYQVINSKSGQDTHTVTHHIYEIQQKNSYLPVHNMQLIHWFVNSEKVLSVTKSVVESVRF